jgi:hypothetical protein
VEYHVEIAVAATIPIPNARLEPSRRLPSVKFPVTIATAEYFLATLESNS